MNGRSTPSSSAKRQSMAGMGGLVDSSSSVKVAVRIRPGTNSSADIPARFQRLVLSPLSTSRLEVENAGPSTAGSMAATAAGGAGKYGKTSFTFDRVLGPEEGQKSVYEVAEPLVQSFLEGMNATILAYGQTSSGKSYTMGTDREGGELDEEDNGEGGEGEERAGIIPRAVSSIFAKLKQAQLEGKGAMAFSAKVSYVEIYNEELIDLLAGDMDMRPTVQIREDKSGHIVWQGLREVAVKSAQEVMNALADGSTLRQTGSTAANAQSSRSHAIFSLTVTQRKWAGPGVPPSISSSSLSSHTTPQSPRNRLSQLPRSPANGRSSTPTSDRPASRSGLRPPSQLGRPQSPSPHSQDGGDGAANGTEAWTNLVSKFHFVDLAGSERLKRTAAVGARATEAISINGGLSALGNVISALGDPSKKATHIPYRDSKLTRLLQDSLGGNSRTMMVACVSPTEWNLHETLSTLKYANRAKNIRNRAEINESEAGWDDIDYLHRTIIKLRSELSSIRAGDAPAMSAIVEEGRRRSIDALANGSSSSAVEFELQQKVAQLTADLARAQSGEPSSSLSRDQFTSAVEPIVEEYERSLSALESQLALTRAALGHSEDEMRELETRVEEEVAAKEANAALVDDLRLRVARLSEREATTEAYVRDLESKLRDVDEAGDTHGAAVSDLRKELSRNRESAETTEQYIKELEARLGKTDESNAALKRQIEVLEREIERREEAHREVEGRIAVLDTGKEHKLLLAEIDEKDRRLLDLERALDNLKLKADSADSESQRLQKLADEEKAAKEELQSTVRTMERAAIVRRSIPDFDPKAPDTPPRTPGDSDAGASSTEGDETPKPDEAVVALQAQVDNLRSSHDETLAQLAAAKEQYAESLKEISELSAQADEAKLLRSQRSVSSLSDIASPASTTFPNGSTSNRQSGDEGEGEDSVEELASSISRSTSPLSSRTTPRTPHARRSMPLSPAGSRLSFLGGRGQSAPSPSGSHSRGFSLSSELSLAAFSQSSSPTSIRPTSPSPGSRERPGSLVGASGLPLPPVSPGERSYEQVREEVLKLQTALNEREAEISQLESTIQQLRTPTIASTSPFLTSTSASPDVSPLVSVNIEHPTTPPSTAFDDEDDGIISPHTTASFSSLKANTNAHDPDGIGLGLLPLDPSSTSPSSSTSSPSVDQTAVLDDLMRSMAQKESSHREAIDVLEGQLVTLQRQHDELTVLSRDQVVNMMSEVEQLRVALEERPEKGVLDQKLRAIEEQVQLKEVEIEEERRRAVQSVETAKRELLEEHQRVLEATLAQHESTLQQLRDEHAEALRLKEVEHEQKVGQAETTRGELEGTVKRLEAELLALSTSGKDDLASSLDQLREEHTAVLTQRQAEFEGETQRLREEHGGILRNRDDSYAEELAKLQAEHDRALADTASTHESVIAELRAEHDSRSKTLADEHSAALEDLKASHSSAFEELASSHAASLAATTADHDERLKELTEAHALEVERTKVELSDAHAGELEALSNKHVEELAAVQAAAGDLDKVREEERTIRRSLVEEQRAALVAMKEGRATELDSVKQQHAEALETLRTSLSVESAASADILRTSLVNDHSSVLDNLRSSLADEHSSALDSLRSNLVEEHSSGLTSRDEAHSAALSAALATATADHEARLKDLVDSHTVEIERTRGELSSAHADELEALSAHHSEELTAVQRTSSDFEMVKEEEGAARKALVEEHEAALSALKEQHSSELASLEQQHSATLDAQRTALSDEHAVALDTLRTSLAEEHATSLDSLRTSLTDEHTTALNTLRSSLADDHSSALDSLRNSLASEHTAAVNLIRSSLADEHSSGLTSRDEGHAAALAAQGQEHSAALDFLRTTLTDEHSTSTTTLSAAHSSALDSLTRDHEAALSSLQQEHAQKLEEQQERHSVALDSLRSSLSGETAAASASATSSLRQAHEAEISALREQHVAAAAEQEERQALAVEVARAALIEEHEKSTAALRAAHNDLVASLRDEHSSAFSSLRDEHAHDLEKQRAEHVTALDAHTASLNEEHSSAVATLGQQHAEAFSTLRDEHSSALSSLRTEHDTRLNEQEQQHTSALDALRSTLLEEHAASVASLEQKHEAAVALLRNQHASALDSLRNDHSSILAQQAQEHAVALSIAVPAASDSLRSVEVERDEVKAAHSSLSAELDNLREDLQANKVALAASSSQHEAAEQRAASLARQYEAASAELATLRLAAQQSKEAEPSSSSPNGELDGEALRLELAKARRERDAFSAQLARQSLSSSNTSPGVPAQAPNGDYAFERTTSPTFRSERFLSNGSTFSNAPPPMPPPSVPPPPAPLPNSPLPPVPTGASPLRTTRSSSQSSTNGYTRGSISGDTSATSVRSGNTDSQTVDPRVMERFKEQESQISRLTKQLAQKESDLQAQLDLANTLDQALNDSERNLRKARLQSNEYARERDQYKGDNERLRLEAQDSHTTSESYRQSVLSLETRLQHERDVQQRGERAKQELESRMAEVNRRKSKFNCF